MVSNTLPARGRLPAAAQDGTALLLPRGESCARGWRSLARCAVVGSLILQGCTTVIVPPVEPREPRPVFLLDHGRHASLALPGSDGGIVLYAYGDWRYYAEAKTGVWEAFTAVLWPTRAGLGRRELPGPPEAETVRRHVRVWVERLHELVVDSERIESLRTHLDSIYESNLKSRIYNTDYDLEFVHHPSIYWAFHNSNEVVALWLRELGCRIRGTVLFSNWKVEPSPEESDALFEFVIVIAKQTERSGAPAAPAVVSSTKK